MATDRRSQGSTTGRIRIGLLCAAVAGLLLAPGIAASEGKSGPTSKAYDPAMAGHPIKILYYALYPVGYVLDTLVLKPAWWLGQREPFRTVFGIDASNSEV